MHNRLLLRNRVHLSFHMCLSYCCDASIVNSSIFFRGMAAETQAQHLVLVPKGIYNKHDILVCFCIAGFRVSKIEK